MKLKFFGIFLFCMLVANSTSFAFSGSYYQSISVNDEAVVEFRVSVDGDKVRTEFPKTPESEVVIKNETGTYRYSPSQKTAIKLPSNIETGSLLDDMNDYKSFLEKHQGERKGQEKIGEYETTLYHFIDPLTQKPAKAWVWEEKNFPVRIIVDAPEGALKVELSEINLGSQVDSSLFQLPEGTNIVDITQALGQISEDQSN